MKRSIELLTASTASLVLLSACSTEAQVQTSPNSPIVQQSFDRVQEYWAAKPGLGSIASIQLATLKEPTDSFYCKNTKDAVRGQTIRERTFNVIARYCVGEDTENTIVLSDRKLNSNIEFAQSKGVPAESLVQFIMAHELGHAIADERRVKDSELYADCLAGSAIAQVAADEVPKLSEFFKAAAIKDHGTGEQINDAFLAGAADPKGDVCTTYTS